jgi:hypothetical protein
MQRRTSRTRFSSINVPIMFLPVLHILEFVDRWSDLKKEVKTELPSPPTVMCCAMTITQNYLH